MLAKPIYELSADEAGLVIDTVDRKSWLKVSSEEYDDLLLVASGHAALVREATGRRAQEKSCEVCGKSFTFVRATAAYCSEKCGRRARRRPVSG